MTSQPYINHIPVVFVAMISFFHLLLHWDYTISMYWLALLHISQRVLNLIFDGEDGRNVYTTFIKVTIWLITSDSQVVNKGVFMHGFG